MIELADRRIEIHAPQAGRTAPGIPPQATVAPVVGSPVPVPTLASAGTSCTPGYVGHVYFPDAVVGINVPLCLSCGTPPGPYDSTAGIETVARGLRLR